MITLKKVLLIMMIIVVNILSGCHREADEPVPGRMERIIGEYDGPLSFFYDGVEPIKIGHDCITGRMTALFTMENCGILSLDWRRLEIAEARILEDFLTGTDSESGIWDIDSSAPGSVETYLFLGGEWLCLKASCDDIEAEELLTLVDGNIEIRYGEDALIPEAVD